MKRRTKMMTHNFIPDDIRLTKNKRNSFDGLTMTEKSPIYQPTQDGYALGSGLSGVGTPIHLGEGEAEEIKFPYPSADSPNLLAMTSETKVQDLEMSALKLDIRMNTDPGLPMQMHLANRRAGDIKMIETHLKSQSPEIKVRGSVPKKPLIISSCLLLISLVLLISGTYIAIRAENGSDGLVFWILGVVCGLPGLFYTIKFFKVCHAKCEAERQKALEDIPQE